MDTAITLLFMTILLGGLGILGIRRTLKDKIVFSKKALFEKAEEYTPLQLFLTSLFFLATSLWYNFYLGYMFEYIEKAQILYSQSEIKFEIMAIVPILAILIVLLYFAGIKFQKSYADKKHDMYILEYTLYDKISGLLFFIIIYALMNFSNSEGINYKTVLLSSFFLLSAVVFSVKVLFIKILFNNEYIVFHTFWRPKRTVLWKDVKSIRFEEKNNAYIRLTTKDNKKFIIPARFNGLVSFMSTFKIRNKK